MIGQWKGYLEQNLVGWNLPSHGHWKFIVYNNYQPNVSNIDLLWFHGTDDFPRIVTKLCRHKNVGQREFDNLTRAHRCVPQVVPKPLAFVPHGEFWALWMEGVPGSALPPHAYTPAVLQSAAGMVSSMHDALRDRSGRSAPDRYRRLVVDPFKAVSEYRSDPAIAAACAKVRAAIPERWLESMPVIPQHGDLFPGNLLFHGDQCSVVDWESFGTIDLPMYDLLTLLLSLLARQSEAPEHWDSRIAAQAPGLMDRYVGELELSNEDISLLLPLTLVNWFHLQWTDGRIKFAERMYGTISQYLKEPASWKKLFPRAPIAV
jgi:Ser/Thr protein kinase RdoA (MazF antagonist)